MGRDKKDEEEGHVNPFVGLEKSRVLQEARVFNEMPLNPRKCVHILTKILFLIYQGETIGSTDATETFFAMTKLFQNPDPTLRKMVYLAIKELSTIADDVIIVTASLTKDMNGKEDVYRAGAIRALATITDGHNLQTIERYMKQAIVDRNSAVQSAALVSSLHLFRHNAETVRRWVNEVQQALNSKSQMVQYHALGLLYAIKQKDRLAISKLVLSQLRSPSMRSPYSYCLLIRYVSKCLEEDSAGSDRSMFEFLEGCLRNKSELVVYEAARAIVNLPSATARELQPAVSVLQLLLSSPKPTLRFAAVRTLNKVAMNHPGALKTCHMDMENLITDSNRSIATLAITTLLKIGNENSIDRLMKQITSFMSEISDEFKIVVVEAIKTLCLKFPKKHGSLMSFLSSALRDEGGFEYKKAIVESTISLVENIPEAKEAGLAHLCEFIEDCEFPSLHTRILHMLGEQGATASSPGKYIRFIYNRLILENSVVRAAAVTALSKFGAQCEQLRPSISVLLRRCMTDGDDEVRDRACFSLHIMEQPAQASRYLVNGLPLSLSALERSLFDYCATEQSAPFDIKTVPIETAKPKRSPLEGIDLGSSSSSSKKDTTASSSAGSSSKQPSVSLFEQHLASEPALADYGAPFKTSAVAELTESETEYVVRYVKHVFAKHVAFVFMMSNTMNDQQLENVSVVLEDPDGEIDTEEFKSYPCKSLVYGTPGIAVVVMPLDIENTSLTFTAKMDFEVKDCDPETGECDEEGYPDTYSLEDVEVSMADYLLALEKPNFANAWEGLADAFEQEQTFELSSMNSIEEAVVQIQSFLGMAACEKSDKVNPDRSSHTLLLSGIFVGNEEVLARARLVFDQGVTLQLAVRCKNERLCEIVAEAVG